MSQALSNTDQAVILDSAKQISGMADKVAGFAISSFLLLIFACLRELNPWVRHHWIAFMMGPVVGGVVYSAAVWWLFFRERDIRALAPATPVVLNHVSFTLARARTAGIVAFALVAMLAVWGAKGIA